MYNSRVKRGFCAPQNKCTKSKMCLIDIYFLNLLSLPILRFGSLINRCKRRFCEYCLAAEVLRAQLAQCVFMLLNNRTAESRSAFPKIWIPYYRYRRRVYLLSHAGTTTDVATSGCGRRRLPPPVFHYIPRVSSLFSFKSFRSSSRPHMFRATVFRTFTLNVFFWRCKLTRTQTNTRLQRSKQHFDRVNRKKCNGFCKLQLFNGLRNRLFIETCCKRFIDIHFAIVKKITDEFIFISVYVCVRHSCFLIGRNRVEKKTSCKYRVPDTPYRRTLFQHLYLYISGLQVGVWRNSPTRTLLSLYLPIIVLPPTTRRDDGDLIWPTLEYTCSDSVLGFSTKKNK